MSPFYRSDSTLPSRTVYPLDTRKVHTVYA
jgi:hypothetical protein